MKALIDKAAVLIEALPYIQRFRDAIVVVKFGGSAMENPECVESTLRDIVFMECVGMRPVIVHGGGKAISARLAKLGIASHFINGMRYTCADTIGVVDDVLHTDVNTRLVDGVRKYGGRANDLSGKSIIMASKLAHQDEAGADVDLGYVGEVEDVDVAPILEMLDRNEVPVITPLGMGADGKPYNINADISACRIAAALKARKLVFLSDVPGVLADASDEASLISTIVMSEMPGLVARGVISGGMVPKLTAATEALKAGTNKVHLVDGRLQHSLLLEVFTDQGVGTQILKD
jgi:acetylglutamate kinase